MARVRTGTRRGEVSWKRPRLLIVAQSYPPSGAASAQRPYGLARGMARLGWDVSVLTRSERCQLSRSRGDDPRDDTLVNVTRLPCLSVWSHSIEWRSGTSIKSKFLGAIVRGIALATSRFVKIDHGFLWAQLASRWCAREAARREIDLVFVTVPLMTSALAVARAFRKSGFRYVLDFRDTLPSPGSRAKRDDAKFAVEAESVRAAALITTTTHGQLDTLQSRYPELSSHRWEVVPNWINDEIIKSSDCDARSPTRPIVVHGGSLYQGSRNGGAFLKALSILGNSTDKVLASASFEHYDANGKHYASTLGSTAAALGMSGRVRVLDPVPRSEFIQICSRARILLLLIGEDDGEVQHKAAIPRKLYDYFQAGRPILVVGPKGSEAQRLVESAGRGGFAESDKPEKIAAQIANLWGRPSERICGNVVLERLREKAVLARVDASFRSLVRRSIGP